MAIIVGIVVSSDVVVCKGDCGQRHRFPEFSPSLSRISRFRSDFPSQSPSTVTGARSPLPIWGSPISHRLPSPTILRVIATADSVMPAYTL